MEPLWAKYLHLWLFTIVFLFRYVRVIANFVAYYRYRPVPIPGKPSYFPSDLTVVMPCTILNSATFHKVVSSVLAHPIASLIIPTAGVEALAQHAEFKKIFADPRVVVLHRNEPNRREQTAMAMKLVKTSLVIIADDHTYWPSRTTFLPSLMAPFEDPKIGGVAPVLEVRHRHHPVSWTGFFNHLGMTYLLRRTHEFLATTSIDGGISCLSARFAVFRSEIYAGEHFLHGYLNEYMPGAKTPMAVGDDKFHTRYLAENGWNIRIQGGPDSIMVTELGEWPKYIGQCVRWTRTTWQSNPSVLMQRTPWVRFPYTTYAVLVYSLVRLTFFYELLLLWSANKALKQLGAEDWFGAAAWILFAWCSGWKFVKVFPLFRKYPGDLVYFPAYLVFGWFMSFVKVWSLITVKNTFWATGVTTITKQEAVPLLRTDSQGNIPVIDGVTRGGSAIVTPANGRFEDDEGYGSFGKGSPESDKTA